MERVGLIGDNSIEYVNILVDISTFSLKTRSARTCFENRRQYAAP